MSTKGRSPSGRPRGHIFRRYVVAFVAVVSAVLLASSLVAMYFGYRESQRAIFGIQQEKAQAAALKIEQFVREIEGNLWWTAQATWTVSQEGLAQRRLDFLKLLKRAPAITQLSQLDQVGREQLRVSRVEVDVTGSQADFSRDPKFTEARTGETYFGPVFFRGESEYGAVPEKIRDVLGRLDKSGRHLLGLINDVLDLSKIEAGQLTLTLSEYSMKEVVQAVVTAMESLAVEKGLALRVVVGPDLPVGRGDERRITQVLMNLVGNAVKFMDAGEVQITVGTEDAQFLVSVADTGPGIALADQDRIFEEFQQSNGGRQQKPGTGLGLAITRRIIELHGGRIWVESSPGQGATFRFTLPFNAGGPLQG